MPRLEPGALRLDVTLDRRSLERLDVLKRVSPLAAAKALTFTAEKAIPAWRAANHRAFHMRRAWLDSGVRMRAATPRNLNAQVGSVDKYMGRHVVGIADPKRGQLFIPVYAEIGQVKTHTQMRRTLERADETRRKTFHITTRGGKILVVRRKGKAREPLQILGVLQTGAKVEPHLDALGIVSDVVRREFGPVYERVLLKAIEERRA